MKALRRACFARMELAHSVSVIGPGAAGGEGDGAGVGWPAARWEREGRQVGRLVQRGTREARVAGGCNAPAARRRGRAARGLRACDGHSMGW